MKICQISPLTEAVPPKLYGGTERVVSWLTEELIALGHEVTLFASGDSQTSAKLVAVCPRASAKADFGLGHGIGPSSAEDSGKSNLSRADIIFPAQR